MVPGGMFWVEMVASNLMLLISTALLLVVLGAGVRRRVNQTCALFLAAMALWAGSAIATRVVLWFGLGNALFWMELTTLGFGLIGPTLFTFAGVFASTQTRRFYALVGLGFLVVAALLFPLFSHQIVDTVRLGENDGLYWHLTPWGFAASALPFLYGAAALGILWQQRRRPGGLYLALSLALLLGGTLAGIFLFPALPIISVTSTISICIIGYVVLAQQLFNPLRELTERLEDQVAERTRELEEAASELQRALGRIERHATYLQTAAEVARDAAAIRDVGQLLDETVHLISERFGFYHAGVFLLDEAGEYAVLRAASSKGGQRMLARGHKLAVGKVGIVGWVTGSGKPRVALDVGKDAVWFDNPDLPETRSEMALPLRVRGEVIGALDVQSTEPAAFSDEDIASLGVLADLAAVAIENARLFAEIQATLRELDDLYRLHTREEWEQWVRAEIPVTGYRLDPTGVSPASDAWWPESGETVREAQTITRVDEGGSALATPITLRGQIIGALSFRKDEKSPWTAQNVALVEAVAAQLGLALENVRLLEEAQRRAAQEHTIHDIAGKVISAFDVQTILQTTIEELSQALGASDACVELAPLLETAAASGSSLEEEM